MLVRFSPEPTSGPPHHGRVNCNKDFTCGAAHPHLSPQQQPAGPFPTTPVWHGCYRWAAERCWSNRGEGRMACHLVRVALQFATTWGNRQAPLSLMCCRQFRPPAATDLCAGCPAQEELLEPVQRVSPVHAPSSSFRGSRPGQQPCSWQLSRQCMQRCAVDILNGSFMFAMRLRTDQPCCCLFGLPSLGVLAPCAHTQVEEPLQAIPHCSGPGAGE